MSYLTLQDVFNAQIALLGTKNESDISDSKVLGHLIDEDRKSDEKELMRAGVKYYAVENDIEKVDFRQYRDHDNKVKTQENKANNHVDHAFHRRQVIEKIAYLLGQRPTITHDNETLIDEYMKVLGDDFHDTIKDWATAASNKGQEWVHVWIDKEENFDWEVMDAIGIIPIYERERQKNLNSLIRYFEVEVVTSDITVRVGRDTSRVKRKVHLEAEWWFPDRVEHFEADADEQFSHVRTSGHFRTVETVSEEGRAVEMRKDDNWGAVPWIRLRNNDTCLSDLKAIKPLIDDYDRSVSDESNNLEDIQDALIEVTGSADKPSEIRDNLKNFKVVVTPEADARVHPHFFEIPFEARKEHLEKLEENIAMFGMALHAKQENFGDPSGVALKWLYMPLDLKSNMLAGEMRKALRDLFEFVARFRGVTNVAEDEDVKGFQFEFEKTMIANEREMIELANQSKGSISEKTRLLHDPRVEDVDEEIKELENETQKRAETFNLQNVSNGNRVDVE